MRNQNQACQSIAFDLEQRQHEYKTIHGGNLRSKEHCIPSTGSPSQDFNQTRDGQSQNYSNTNRTWRTINFTRYGILNHPQPVIYLRDLARELVIRDIKVRYKHSILGFAWSLVNPLLHLLVFYFVFGIIMEIGIPRYSSYVFSGLLTFTWFQSSLLQAANTITDNGELIRRPGFPVAVLPVVTVITNFIHLLFALPILAIFLFLEGGNSGPMLLAFPVIILLQFMLTLGPAYLVAGANVVFRDVQYLLSVLLQLCFFLTPVFYESDLVPAHFQPMYHLNPFVSLVNAYRNVLIYGAWPDWKTLWWPCLLAVVFMFVGYRLFMHIKFRFVEEL